MAIKKNVVGAQRKELLVLFRDIQESSEKLMCKLHLKAFYQGMNGKSISACANMFSKNKDSVFGKSWQRNQLS